MLTSKGEGGWSTQHRAVSISNMTLICSLIEIGRVLYVETTGNHGKPGKIKFVRAKCHFFQHQGLQKIATSLCDATYYEI